MFLIPSNFWEIRETKNKGRGVFAKKPIPTGTIIGDYVGKLIQLNDVDFDKEKKNLYLMYYNDEIGIYPDLKKPGVYLINHSCSSNCMIYEYIRHTLVFAFKNIKKNEELTISYLLPPKMNCKKCRHNCFCGSINCTGSMHLTEEKYKKWRDFQEKEESKIYKINNNTNELKPLTNYPKSIPKSYIAKIKSLGIL